MELQEVPVGLVATVFLDCPVLKETWVPWEPPDRLEDLAGLVVPASPDLKATTVTRGNQVCQVGRAGREREESPV